MNLSNAITVAALVLSAGAAVAEPVAYPAKGQSFDQQNRDEYECHQWAQTETGVDPVAVAEQATGSRRSRIPKERAESGADSVALPSLWLRASVAGAAARFAPSGVSDLFFR